MRKLSLIGAALALAACSSQQGPADGALELGAVEAGVDSSRDVAAGAEAGPDIGSPDTAPADLPSADLPLDQGGAADLGHDVPSPDAAAADAIVADTSMADAAPACPAGYWCSKLYPPAWSAGHAADSQGRYLDDYSYAGYHNGQLPLPIKPPGKLYDVVKQYGADSSGKADATAAIQQAIKAAAAAGGGVVYLPAGSYRCDGQLIIDSSKVVLRGAGKSTKLHFTKHKGLGYSSHIVLRGKIKQGADIPLVVDAKARATVVQVQSAAGLKVGDDVSLGWVITPGFVKAHGMQGYWQSFYKQWKPFFRRTVVAIDTSAKPHRVTLNVPLRYAAMVKHKASLRHETGHLRECGVEHLAVSNAVKWSDAWANNQLHVIGLQQAKDCWILDVHSTASPHATGWSKNDKTAYHLQSGGMRITDSKRVTVSGCTMQDPQHRGGGGNGYLFHLTRSNEVLVKDSQGLNGRHNLIQNWDFGTTGCVFLRCKSVNSHTITMVLGVPVAWPAMSEYHHSLAMANLVDSCQLDDGWMAANRGSWSSGAGHTSTQCVFWNTTGKGRLQSMQYAWGYIIGTGSKTKIDTSLLSPSAAGTKPADYVEGAAKGATLWPRSLYEDQLARRKAAAAP